MLLLVPWHAMAQLILHGAHQPSNTGAKPVIAPESTDKHTPLSVALHIGMEFDYHSLHWRSRRCKTRLPLLTPYGPPSPVLDGKGMAETPPKGSLLLVCSAAWWVLHFARQGPVSVS